MRFTLDANVLVYAADLADPRHYAALDLVTGAARADCVQTLQSLAEFYFVATRKGKALPKQASGFVETWRTVFPICAADEGALVLAIGAVQDKKLAFWDAMLWATAKRAGCRLIFSEDFQHGFLLDGVQFVNPFSGTTHPLLERILSRRD